jgi:hypothetical protein
MADIYDRITEYCEKIALTHTRPIMIHAEHGRRFTRIVIDNSTQRHVHAFVDTTNGDVIKAAGWNAPQRGKNGLAVRFNLLDDESRERGYSAIDPYGSYLYEGVLDKRVSTKI